VVIGLLQRADRLLADVAAITLLADRAGPITSLSQAVSTPVPDWVFLEWSCS
jgi:hypothetical protein